MDNIDFSKIYSPSKLKLFEQCPKAYHFTYLDPVYSKMKSQLRRDPANIWPFYIIGRSVHDAITLFLHLSKDEQTVENLKEQLKLTWRSEAMFRKLPPLGKWGGFKTIEEERIVYKESLEMLINFFQTYNREQKIKLLPIKDLTRSIEDYKNLIKPISADFDISGKFDLVLEPEEGSLAVVDFKTSKREESDDFQLQFYKLLAELNFKTPVSRASFYYLRTGNIKEFDLSQKDTEEIKADVLNRIKKIQEKKNEEKDFETRPSKLCQFCLFRTFCPAKKEVAKFTQESLSEDFSDDLPF